jgi:polyferredoxin
VPPARPAAPAPLDLSAPRDALGVRRHSALRSAAWWLRSAVVIDFGTSALGCCTLTAVADNPDVVLALLGGAVIFEYLPLILVAVGAPDLQARRNYRLCLAAAVLVLPPSLWALVQTWFAGRMGVSELAQGEPAGAFFLALAAVTLFGAAAGVTGAVKALALLTNSEVKHSFR